MSFLGEIKRRKVFQVAAVYAVVAWLTIQIVDVVGEPLNLPDWFATVVIVLFAVGFPLALILAWAFDVTPHGIVVDKGSESSIPAPQLAANKGTILIQGFVLIAVIGLLVTDRFLLSGNGSPRESAPQPSSSLVERSEIPIGAISGTIGSQYVMPTISPDRQHVAYSAFLEGTGGFQLYLRSLAELDAHIIPVIDEAIDPVFSPDGDFVYFFSKEYDQIWRVNINGGQPEPVTSRMRLNNGLWVTEDEVFVFAQTDSGSVLHTLGISGDSENEIHLNLEDPVVASWPSSLPDERHLLVTLTPSGRGTRENGRVALLDTETGVATELLAGYNARYVDTGHVLFVRDNSGDGRSHNLWAVPFDWRTLTLRGSEVLVQPELTGRTLGGAAAYSVTDDGLLIYAPSRPFTDLQRESHLVWIDRDGNRELLDLPAALYGQLRISPDGEHVAYIIGTPGDRDIWIHTFSSGATRKRTTTTGNIRGFIWSADGSDLIFTVQDGQAWRVSALGIDQPREIDFRIPYFMGLFGSPEEERLLYVAEVNGEEQLNQVAFSDSGPSDEILVVAQDERFLTPSLSPDSQWLAYHSGDALLSNIYLRPFPNATSGRSQLTHDGAASPILWGPGGRELLYRDSFGGRYIMRVTIDESGIPTGAPSPAIAGNPPVFFGAGSTYPQFAIHPIDGRVLVTEPTASASRGAALRSLIVVNNWFEELRRLAPASE